MDDTSHAGPDDEHLGHAGGDRGADDAPAGGTGPDDGADDAVLDAARQAARAREAEAVRRIREGDQSAFAELYDDWFDRVHDLVARIVRDREVAAEVAQDTFLTAWQKLDTLEQPEAFGGWLLRIARNRALNRHEREQRAVAVDDDVLAGFDRSGGSVSAPDGFGAEVRLSRAADPAAAAEDGEIASLLWSAADALGERDATVLNLQLRYGMTPAEIGEVVGVNRNAANQLVHRVKGRLETAVRARVLWTDDGPVCEQLRAELAEAGVDAFDERAVTLVSRHVDDCDECGERQRLRLAPTALFGALPLLAVPAGLREQVTAALAGQGVPVDASVPPTASADADATSPSDGGSGSGSRTADGSSPPPVTTEGGARPGPGGVASSTARRRALAAAAVVAALLLAIVAVAVVSADGPGDQLVLTDADDDDGTETGEATTTTVASAAAPTTTPDSVGSIAPVAPDAGGPTSAPPGSVVTPPVDSGDAPSSGSGGSVTPPGPAPDGGGPAPVPVTTQLTVSPTTAPGTFIAAASLPTLTWSTGGVASVVVSGPGVNATSLSGSTRVCPGIVVPGGCQGQFGTHTWTLVAFDAGGSVVGLRSATITV